MVPQNIVLKQLSTKRVAAIQGILHESLIMICPLLLGAGFCQLFDKYLGSVRFWMIKSNLASQEPSLMSQQFITIWSFKIKLPLTDSFTLSRVRSLPYRNQPIDLRSKSMNRFLYDRDLRHEIIKKV